MHKNIYISSLAFEGKNLHDILQICETNRLNLECTSGMGYHNENVILYKNSRIKRQPHNYFPEPKIPFVLNLGSTNSAIRKLSVEHCIKGLILAKQSNSLFYAAHAGFCVDPKPEELGNEISFTSGINRELNKKFFIQSVMEVVAFAEKLDIDFYIENNVLSPFNFRHGENPVLCCESSELLWLKNEVSSNRFGILLDTAHLKVSCQTLALSLSNEASRILPLAKAFHHSDNNGFSDTNDKLTPDYWFMGYLKDLEHFVHVVEVKNLNINEILQHNVLITSQWK